MPSKKNLTRIVANNPTDLRDVRIPGLSKSFEELTVSELVQLRPGSNVADTYEVNAVTDNVSATTSAALEALGRIHKEKAINQVQNQDKLNNLRGQLGFGGAGGFSRFSAEQPDEDEVSLSDDDVFSAGGDDPFKT